LDSPQTYEASSSEYKNSVLKANEIVSVCTIIVPLFKPKLADEQILQSVKAKRDLQAPLDVRTWLLSQMMAICLLARAPARVID
jgi:hypothetical protein